MSGVKTATRIVAALALAAPVVLAAGSKEGEPPPEALVKALETFDKAARGRDSKVLVSAVHGLARAGAKVEDKQHKELVRKRLRACLGHPAADVKVAALKGYGKMAIPRTSKDIAPLADPKRNKKADQKVVLAAIEAWGRIGDTGTHGVLLSYIKVPSHKPERRQRAQKAASSLQYYEADKGQERHALLRDFIKAFDQIYGAVGPTGTQSASANQWWGALASPMVRSFNVLAKPEKRLSSYQDCTDWWRKNQRDVKAGRR
jgi:hypothetical protein